MVKFPNFVTKNTNYKISSLSAYINDIGSYTPEISTKYNDGFTFEYPYDSAYKSTNIVSSVYLQITFA